MAVLALKNRSGTAFRFKTPTNRSPWPSEETSKEYKFVPFTDKFSNKEIQNVLKIKERKFYDAMFKFSKLGIVYPREVLGFCGYVIPINVPPCPDGIEHIKKVKERIRRRAEVFQEKKKAYWNGIDNFKIG